MKLFHAVVLSLALCGVLASVRADVLEAGFAQPPISARPLGWWHWINGNVTKEGIAEDLEAAKKAGMGGVQMFDVEMYLPPGPVRYGTDNWYEHVRFAMEKAAELGLEFHIMNTPGWSASGGPWVTPARSMKRLVWTETSSDGGEIVVELPLPVLKPIYSSRTVAAESFYRDIAVFAVPATTRRIPDFEKKAAWGARPITRSSDADRAGITHDQVMNLTASLDDTGRVTATLPAGKWTLLRIGFTTTGKTNHPAVKEGHGLEIDKLDTQAVAFQFEQSLGRLLKEARPLAGTTFNALLFDSFEGGFQNWTASLPESFRAQKDYELMPWLPVLTGRVIGSIAETEAVLWDFRDVIEELIAENYYGTMHRLAAKHGLKIYSESQGGPITPMSANRHVDVPMNEFWTPDAAARATRIKMTTSSASFRGRNVVAAEAFTSTPENGKYQNTPATLKRAGDYAFTLGLNRFALHSFTHQPVTELAPGFALGRYGVHFGRLNTWWPYADAWMSYLSRSQFLLQQGRVVADVCLLVDEDLGYGLPSAITDALPGYDYEVAYPEQVREMTVRDGSLVHPSGRTFRVLVTPGTSTGKDWVAELSTLRHLENLVAAGTVLAGRPPVAPAGWKDQEHRVEFDQLVAKIWGSLEDPKLNVRRVGAGKVYRDLPLLDLLRAENLAPDVSWGTSDPSVKFIHRATSEADLYFVFNNSDQTRRVALDFRQVGRTPEIWDPVSGARNDAPIFDRTQTGVAVPMEFEAWGSTFVVFRKPLPIRWLTSAEPTSLEIKSGPLTTTAAEVSLTYSDGQVERRVFGPLPSAQSLEGPWQVEFKEGRGAPSRVEFDRLISWTEQSDPAIRFYSGTAVYRTQFTADEVRPGQIAVLDLGRVADIARVFVNGREIGVLWKPPFRCDGTRFVEKGVNVLEVRVANRWINRLVGDEAVDPGFRYQNTGANKFTDGRLLTFPDWLYDASKRAERPRQSFSTWKHYDADSPLVPAGLLGPVKLEWLHQIESN